MRTFGTHGPVNPHDNYIVTRAKETADFIQRIKNGKYIVIFAPRQTGKTTFFQQAVDTLTTQEHSYFPIQLNVETYENLNASDFYNGFPEDVHETIDKELMVCVKSSIPSINIAFCKHSNRCLMG